MATTARIQAQSQAQAGQPSTSRPGVESPRRTLCTKAWSRRACFTHLTCLEELPKKQGSTSPCLAADGNWLLTGSMETRRRSTSFFPCSERLTTFVHQGPRQAGLILGADGKKLLRLRQAIQRWSIPLVQLQILELPTRPVNRGPPQQARQRRGREAEFTSQDGMVGKDVARHVRLATEALQFRTDIDKVLACDPLASGQRTMATNALVKVLYFNKAVVAPRLEAGILVGFEIEVTGNHSRPHPLNDNPLRDRIQEYCCVGRGSRKAIDHCSQKPKGVHKSRGHLDPGRLPDLIWPLLRRPPNWKVSEESNPCMRTNHLASRPERSRIARKESESGATQCQTLATCETYVPLQTSNASQTWQKGNEQAGSPPVPAYH